MSTVIMRADLRCYHCGHTSAQIQVERGRPMAEARLLPPAGLEGMGPERPSLRCSRCQGPLFMDAEEVVRAASIVAEPMSPLRRGRPPGSSRKQPSYGRAPYLAGEVASA